jgi:hypothetical protein
MGLEEDKLDDYEPSEEERRDIEEILNHEAQKEKEENQILQKLKQRSVFTFKSDTHFEGWLKIHGIKW